MIAFVQLVKDPYELKARVYPALLVILPLLVAVLCVFGHKNPYITGVVGLLSGCGAIYLVASIARNRGKKLEERLVQEWGGMPTTILLRHRDRWLDGVTKSRYHQLIASRLAIAMPSEADERTDPGRCDESYIGATRKLRERTRATKGLLLKENIAYGFHRNMCAMKSVGILLSTVGLAFGLLLAGVFRTKYPYFDGMALLRPGFAGALTIIVSLGMLIVWIFFIDQEAVRRMGFAYAERLFECLESLRSKR